MKLNLKSILFPFKSKKQNALNICILFFLFLFSFSIPAFSNIYPWNFLSIGISVILVLLIFIYLILFGSWKIDIFAISLILFNVVILLSHLLTLNVIGIPKSVFLLSLVSFFIYQYLSTSKNKNVIFQLILLSGLFFAIVYMVFYRDKLFPLSFGYGSRLGDYFDNQNEISKEFGFFAIISFAVLISNIKNIWTVIFSLFSILLFVFLILTTGSISNLLTLVIVSVTTLLVVQKTKKARLISLSACICTICLLLLLLQLPSLSYFKNRIFNIFSTFLSGGSNYDSSTLSRFEATLISFKVGLDRILFGHGYMSATSFTPGNIQSHNNFAELFIDFGVTGLLFFEFIILFPLIMNIRTKKSPYLIAMILYIFVFQLFLTLYYKKFEYLILPGCYALLPSEVLNPFSMFRKKKIAKMSKSLSILEIIPALYPVGGAEVFVKNLIIAIRKEYPSEAKVTLVLLYSEEAKELEKAILENGVDIVRLNKRHGIDLICAFKLRKVIKKLRPDVIHTHLNTLLTLKIAMPFKKNDIVTVHTIHQNAPAKLDLKHIFLGYLFRNNYTRPIAVAREPSKNYSKLYGFDIDYINNGVFVDSYSNRIPLNKRKYDFICAGRFVEVKNQLYLLDIISKSFKDKPYNFHFLGDGPLLEKCKDFVKSENIQNVYFDGFVKNVDLYLANSKVLLIPSLNEGNPMVINEALACGMLVVGNNVGGIHDLLLNNYNGFLVDINDKENFALIINQAIENANKTDRLLNNNDSSISIVNTAHKYFNIFKGESSNEF